MGPHYVRTQVFTCEHYPSSKLRLSNLGKKLERDLSVSGMRPERA